MQKELDNIKSPAYSLTNGFLLASFGFFFGHGVGLFNTFAEIYLPLVHNITGKS